MSRRQYTIMNFIMLCLYALLVFAPKAAHASEHIISAGDQLQIDIYNEAEASRLYTLPQNGTLTMPLIGDIHIAGLTLEQAKSKITTAYANGYIIDPIINITITTYQPIYILGEVRTPGQYPYAPGLSALQAIATAGGYTYRANKKTLLLKHASGTSEKIKPSYTLRPGDTIQVKERFF